MPCCRLVDERNRAVSRHFCSPDAVEAYEAVRWPKGGVEGGNSRKARQLLGVHRTKP
jgi:hypothetical protein